METAAIADNRTEGLRVKLFICGHARHGKDTAANFLCAKFGLSHESSSHFCMRLFLRDQLRIRYGITYRNEDECFADRINHRDKWHELIADYNKDDPTRLSRELFAKYDIYVGIRSAVESVAAKELADLSLWIEDPRKPVESSESNKIQATHCDVTILNDGNLDTFFRRLNRLFMPIMKSKDLSLS